MARAPLHEVVRLRPCGDPDFCTIGEAARWLRCGREAIWQRIASASIPPWAFRRIRGRSLLDFDRISREEEDLRMRDQCLEEAASKGYLAT